MICIGNDYPVEKYKDYRNRTIKKHFEKFLNQLEQIRQCSLKDEDKKKLLQQFEQMIKEQN